MKYVAPFLFVAYVLALRLMVSSEVAMAILSSGGHFPAWAILAALLVLLLRIVVFVALPAALFAKMGMATIDAWPRESRGTASRRSARPRISRFVADFTRKSPR